MKLSLFFLFFSLISIGQNIKKHQWENRILLIYSEDTNSKNTEHQKLILQEHQKEINERKIVVYQFTKEQFNFNFKGKWKNSNSLYQKYIKKSTPFKILLVGLDGGIKLEQNSIISSEKLFTIIDGMPMRKRELRNKK